MVCLRNKEINWHTLYNHVNASVITSKGVRRYAGEECRIASLRSFDAEICQDPVCENFFADRVT